MAAAIIQTVVQVNGFQTIQTDYFVKFRKYTIQIANDVIACVPYMTGIQANAQLLRKLHPVQDLPELLKPASHLAALSGHGLQKHRGGHIPR